MTFALMALVFFSNCHTAKKAMKAKADESAVARIPAPVRSGPDAEAVLSGLRKNRIHFETFSARVKLDINSEQGSQTGIAAFIRMQRDSAIWISVRPVLGIELVRVLITPDTLKMINFFKKTVTIRSSDSMQQLLDVPFDFASLQNLLVGNPVFLTDTLDHLIPDSAGSGIAFSCTRGPLKSTYVLSAANFQLEENQLSVRKKPGAHLSSREIFQEYKSVDNRNFSTRRSVEVHARQESTVEIKFNRVDFDEPLNFPFPIVTDFKRN